VCKLIIRQGSWPRLSFSLCRVFHMMCRHAGFRWGGSGVAGTHSRLGSARRQSGRAALFCGLCSEGLFCVFPFSVSLLSLLSLFAVLLNCPYHNLPVSACFFPFSSAPQREEGQPRGAFFAGHSQTITVTSMNSFLPQKCKTSPSHLHNRMILYYVYYKVWRRIRTSKGISLDKKKN